MLASPIFVNKANFIKMTSNRMQILVAQLLEHLENGGNTERPILATKSKSAVKKKCFSFDARR